MRILAALSAERVEDAERRRDRGREAEVDAEALDELVVDRAGSGEDDLADRLGLRLGHVVVDRQPDLVGEARAGVLVVPDRGQRPGEEASRTDGDARLLTPPRWQ